jgi:hypothetical protein
MKRLILILAVACLALSCMSYSVMSTYQVGKLCPQCNQDGVYAAVTLDYVEQYRGCLGIHVAEVKHYSCNRGHQWTETE